MKRLTRILIDICLFVLFLLFGNRTIEAQWIVSASGIHAGNDAVQLSWTIGEVVTATISDGNNILTQGMHQSKLTVTAIEEIVGSGLNISVYPNPAADYVHLKIILPSQGNAGNIWKDFSFQLYNLNGQVLMYKQIEDQETVIRLDSYPSSTYFLRVIDNEDHHAKSNGTEEKPLNVVKTYKIIKQ
jgi:hypothetical protein